MGVSGTGGGGLSSSTGGSVGGVTGQSMYSNGQGSKHQPGGGGARVNRQGLTLVHVSAQPEPFLTQNTPSNTPEHLLNAP